MARTASVGTSFQQTTVRCTEDVHVQGRCTGKVYREAMGRHAWETCREDVYGRHGKTYREAMGRRAGKTWTCREVSREDMGRRECREEVQGRRAGKICRKDVNAGKTCRADMGRRDGKTCREDMGRRAREDVNEGKTCREDVHSGKT